MYYIDLLGKPFEYGGRGPDKFDCYGLAVELHRRSGSKLPDYTSCDDPGIIGNSFCDGIDKHLVQVETPKELDLILFQVVPKFVSHCGIYVGHGRFVHIMSKTNVTCEELRSPVWKNRVRGIYRYRGLM